MSDALMTKPGTVLGDALAYLDAAVDGVVGIPAWTVQERELPAAIRALARVETRLAAARLALLREAADRGVRGGGGTTAARWLRGLLNESPGRAAEEVRVADALRDPDSPTAAVLAAGEISVEHAKVITRVLAQVRADGADAELLGEAETFLLGQARMVDPAQLAKLGRHLRYVADPEQGDDRLAFREKVQAARRELSMYQDPDGSGMTLLRGRLDPLGAATVAAALDPLAAPRPAADGARDLRSAARRRADALVELCQRALDDGRLPTQGGERPTLIITIGLAMLLGLLKTSGTTDPDPDPDPDPDDTRPVDGLDSGGAAEGGRGGLGWLRGMDGSAAPAGLGDLTAPGRALGLSGVPGLDRPDHLGGPGVVVPHGHARLDRRNGARGLDGQPGRADGLAGVEWLPPVLPSGQPVSAATVRRIACDAGIIPLVLGSASEPLDIGRRSRTWPAAIRRAVAARDGGCSRPGCDVPPEWAQIHHIRHWADGGPTSIANAAMVCDPCHDLLHHGEWTVAIDADGHPLWTPPPWLDIDQLPPHSHWRRELQQLAANQARRRAARGDPHNNHDP